MAKTKAEIKGLSKVQLDLRTFVRNSIKDKELLEDIGKTSSGEILRQTRSRLGEYKQPDITKSTQERRAALIKQGNSSEFAKPKRSNLTLSGQLLDALTYSIEQTTSNIKLFFKENRKPYKGKKGKDLEIKTNKEIVIDLDRRGFKFLFISDRLKVQLESKIKAFLRRKLSNFKQIKRSLK